MTDTGDWSGATSNTRYWSHKRQEILLEQRRQILETGVEPQATDTVSSGCRLWLQWLLLVAPVSVVTPVSAVSHLSCCGSSSICRSWLQYLLPVAVRPMDFSGCRLTPVAVDRLQWLSFQWLQYLSLVAPLVVACGSSSTSSS